MMVLVIGGSGSGKSSYAEEILCSLAEKERMKKYYLATMRISDRECERKIERHRKLRAGKGFLTLEQPMQIECVLGRMEAGKRAALLECISNLTANEMFSGIRQRPETETAEKIMRGVAQLKQETAHLVVVSNNIFEDGVLYDEATMKYIRAVGMINRMLAGLSDRVVEIVAGIPVPVKQ